jgi:hypothetical protein
MSAKIPPAAAVGEEEMHERLKQLTPRRSFALFGSRQHISFALLMMFFYAVQHLAFAPRQRLCVHNSQNKRRNICVCFFLSSWAIRAPNSNNGCIVPAKL